MSARQAESIQYVEAARLDRIVFWNPLPIGNGLSEESSRLVRESNADIRANRLESALDSSLALNALAPGYIPGFIRTSELLVATDRTAQARRLTDTVARYASLHENGDFDLALARVSAHINPESENVYRVARTILDGDSTQSLTPYVPAAIEALAQDGRDEDALELAGEWAEKREGDALANAYLIREQLRADDAESAERVIRGLREQYDLDRIWPENVIASGIVAITKPGDPPNWEALAAGCQDVRNRRLRLSSVLALLEFLIPVTAQHQRALIASGLLCLSAGDIEDAQAVLQTVSPSDDFERYLVGVALARVAESTSDNQLRVASLSDAVEALQDEKVAQFAASSEVLSPKAPLDEIGLQLVEVYRQREAYAEALAILDMLRNSGQSGLENSRVERIRAEILGQSGSRTEALNELDKILQRQEAENQHRAAIQTMESMVKLLPGNLTLRSRLVDKYLRVGQFNEAIEQLVLQARILVRAGRTPDSLPPMHRSIEIATMVNDWDRVQYLHRLMISFDPDDTAIRHSAVATYVQHGRTDEALEQLREIARIAQERNDPDEAIAASHQMLALAPEEPSTYHQLGELLLSIEEFGQAERVYRRLAALVPDDPAIAAKRSAIAAMARNRQ